MVFGAANAYLGLRVGMTVSASIPAAVVTMGIIRVILNRNSILERYLNFLYTKSKLKKQKILFYLS